MQSRREAEDHSGCDRRQQREKQDGPVDRHFVEPRQAVRHELQEGPLRGEEDNQPGDSAEQRQEQALRQQLPDQPRSPGSQRLANGDLGLPSAGARQEEVGDVHAADQEDQPDGAEQQNQRLADVAHDRFLERHQSNRPPALRRVIGGILLLQARDQRVEPALRRRQRQPGFETRDRFRQIPPVARRLRLQRRAEEARCRPDFGVPFCRSRARRVKAGRHDADDAVQVGIEPQRPVEDSRVAPERAPPQAIADHDFAGESRRVVVGIEDAPQLRFHA